VVDDQVHHHPDTPAGSLFQEMLQSRLGVAAILRIKKRINPEVVFHRVQAAGEAGGVDGVEIDPGETQGRDAVQVVFPPGDRAD